MILNNRYEYNPSADFLANGSSSKVYKAHDTELNKTVVVKFYHSISMEPEDFIKKMESLKKLEHKNLIQLYDYFELDNINHFGEVEHIRIGIWEYVETKNWNHKEETDSTKDDVIKGILNAVQYLEKNDEVHGDLSWDNLLIGNDNVPKLNNTSLTFSPSIPTVKGLNQAAYYRSPEQFETGATSKADMWSVGLIIQQLVSGYFPFKSKMADNLSEAKIKSAIESHKQRDPKNIRAVYKSMIHQCLDKDHEKRVIGSLDLVDTLNHYDRNQELNSIHSLSMDQFHSRYDHKEDLIPEPGSLISHSSYAIDRLTKKKMRIEMYNADIRVRLFEAINLKRYHHIFKILIKDKEGLSQVVLAGIVNESYAGPAIRKEDLIEPMNIESDENLLATEDLKLDINAGENQFDATEVIRMNAIKQVTNDIESGDEGMVSDFSDDEVLPTESIRLDAIEQVKRDIENDVPPSPNSSIEFDLAQNPLPRDSKLVDPELPTEIIRKDAIDQVIRDIEKMEINEDDEA